MNNLESYKILSKYYRKIIGSRNHYDSMAQVLTEIFDVNKQMKILDASCGQGNLNYSKKFPNWQIFGNDGSKEMIDSGNDQAKFIKVFNYKWTELEKLFEDETSFNTILFLGNSISHVKNISEFTNVLKQTQKGLAKAGKIVFDMRNWKFDKKLDRFIEPGRKIGEERLLVSYTVGDGEEQIFDYCTYEGNQQYINIIVKRNNFVSENLKFSCLIISPEELENSLNECGLKISNNLNSADYPYRVVICEQI